MRRILVLSITIAVLATACGDSGGLLSAANWCETARSVDTASNAFDSPTNENIREFSRLVDESRSSAPAEIKDDVNLLAEFLQQFTKALDDNDNNILLAFDALGDTLNDPKYENAGDRITAYNERECGITDTDASDNSGDSSSGTQDSNDAGGSTDTIVPPGGLIAGLAENLGITEDQARCLVSKFDFTSAEDPSVADMMSGFVDCGIDPTALGAGG